MIAPTATTSAPLVPPAVPRAAPHVLLYTDDPERGGVAQYNHALLTALVALGYRTTCVQPPSDSPLIAAQRAAGVDHHWLPYDPAAEFGRTLTDMEIPRTLFTHLRPDLVIFSDCCPLSNLGARQTALALRIPYMVVVGFAAAYLAKQFAPCLPVLARHYQQARQVIAVSQENLSLLRAHFGLPAHQGEVIHYGRPAAYFQPVDADTRQRLRAQLGMPADAVVALTTARLTKIKGYLFQIAALRSLVANKLAPNLHLLWLGEGEQRAALETEILRHGLQSRVTLLGHRWDAPSWYDAADIYILPTELEGMPLAIMEAMAKGLPVAASAVSGIPEELGPTGQLLPDPKASPDATVRQLALTLSAWSADPTLRARLGQASRQRACELFREPLMIRRTLAHIHALLPPPAARTVA